MSSGAPVGAVFIDRDGTVNRELSSYVRSPAQLEIFPYSADALKPLAERDIPVIIVSNQAGVGKGLMTEEDLLAIEARLRAALGAAGVTIHAAYYCRHTDAMCCPCRKPKGGLLRLAAKELHIDLANSYMIGDSWRDMAAGRDAGVTTVFVPTGINPEEQARRAGNMADYRAASLADAVSWICHKRDREE